MQQLLRQVSAKQDQHSNSSQVKNYNRTSYQDNLIENNKATIFPKMDRKLLTTHQKASNKQKSSVSTIKSLNKKNPNIRLLQTIKKKRKLINTQKNLSIKQFKSIEQHDKLQQKIQPKTQYINERKFLNQTIYQHCIRINKDKLKYPELATLLEKLYEKQKQFTKKKNTRQVSIQNKIEKYLKKNNQFKDVNGEVTNQVQQYKNYEIINKQSRIMKLKHIKFPKLPPRPDPQASSAEMLMFGKELFKLFKMYKKNEFPLINVEKYKNCFHIFLQDIHIIWYDSNRFYIGQYKIINNQGLKHGYGIQYLPNKYLYKGEFIRNKKSGMGRLKFQDGNYYIGQFVNGYQQGYGRLYQNNKTLLYSGQWKNGQFEGYGKLILKNNEVYQGQFSKGVQNGYGKLTFQNKDSYNGYFLNGKFNGLGTYLWKNGQIYQGEFVDGLRHGMGIWHSRKIHNKFDEYYGEYKYDKKQGVGRYIWRDKSCYEGEFRDDQRDGIGIMKQKNKSIKAEWINGLIKKILYQDQLNQQHSNNHLKTKFKIKKQLSQILHNKTEAMLPERINPIKQFSNIHVLHRQKALSSQENIMGIGRINKKSMQTFPKQNYDLEDHSNKKIQLSRKLKSLYN